MAETDDTVLIYTDRFYCLNNFSAFAVEMRGRVWPTAEHAYQAAKFFDPGIIAIVGNARSAHDAKKFARANDARKREDWDHFKHEIMEDVLRAKLEQHSLVRQQLLETGDRIIIENSPTDSFWGRGPDWEGHNHFGKLWMKLRAELRAEQTAG